MLFFVSLDVYLYYKFSFPERGVKMDDVLDDFVTLFVAGQETTANALTFLMAEVGRHPHVYEKSVLLSFQIHVYLLQTISALW